MANQNGKAVPAARPAMTGLERLGLRVSSMINHPTAQHQRWVTIHRLDTDGDQEWEEVMGLLTETDDLEMTFHGDDSVMLRWEARSDEDRVLEVTDLDEVEEPAPF